MLLAFWGLEGIRHHHKIFLATMIIVVLEAVEMMNRIFAALAVRQVTSRCIQS